MVFNDLHLQLDGALEPLAQHLLGVPDQEVHLASHQVPLNQGSHPDCVMLSLDDDLTQKHARPGALHELPDEHVLHEHLVTCKPNL